MTLAPAAGINPYVVEDGKRYFLVGKEISTQKWSGFTGGYEDRDQNVINTAVRELMEESCNIFLPWEKSLVKRLKNNQNCTLIKSTTPRGREMFAWFVQFHVDLKKQSDFGTRFQENRKKMYDAHYLEKHSIKWVPEDDVLAEDLGRGYRKDLKSFLKSTSKI